MAEKTDKRSIEDIADLLLERGEPSADLFFTAPDGSIGLLRNSGEFINLGIRLESPEWGILTERPEESQQLEKLRKEQRKYYKQLKIDKQTIDSKVLTNAIELSIKYSCYIVLISEKDFFSKQTAQFSGLNSIYFIILDFDEHREAKHRYSFISTDSDIEADTAKQITEFIITYSRSVIRPSDVSTAKRVEKANQISLELYQKIVELQKAYYNLYREDASLNKLADLLNVQQVETPGGSTKWYAITVKRVLERYSNLTDEANNQTEST